jgi:hypothetical protein
MKPRGPFQTPAIGLHSEQTEFSPYFRTFVLQDTFSIILTTMPRSPK